MNFNMENLETFHQTLSMMTVGLNELAVAIDDGWLIPSTYSSQDLRGELLSNTTESALWSTLLDKYIGRIIGAVIAAILLDKVGRKSLLSICATTFCSTWLLMIFAKSVWILYLVRIAIGIARGLNDVTNAVYLGENSSPSNRGIFGAIIRIIYSFGFLIGFISAALLHFRTAALINFFITLLSLISIFWIVEPVQYLLMKGKYDQAEKNFIWLKGDINSDEIADEFREIKQNVYAETFKKSSAFKIFTYPANSKSLLVILTISSVFAFINYHVGTLTYLLHFTSTYIASPTWSNLVTFIGITRIVVVAPIPFIIRRLKRKSMMIISFLLILVPLLLFAGSLVFPDLKNVYFRLTCLVIYCGIFEVAVTILFLLRSELFPLSMKALGGSLSIIVATFSRFFMAFLLSEQDFHIVSILLLGLVIILGLFLYFVKWPETGNKTLIEIQEELEGGN